MKGRISQSFYVWDRVSKWPMWVRGTTDWSTSEQTNWLVNRYVTPKEIQSVYQSVSQSVYQSVSLSVSLSVCLSACQSVYQSVSLSVNLSVCLSVSLSVCQYVYLSVSQSTNSRSTITAKWSLGKAQEGKAVFLDNTSSDGKGATRTTLKCFGSM